MVVAFSFWFITAWGDSNKNGSETCETIYCNVALSNGSSVTIGSFYRPPGSNTAQPLFEFNNVLFSLNATYLLLAGDFNLPNVQWIISQPILSSSSLLYTAFREVINAHSLYQFVETPTRLGVSSANVLDLLFSNDRDVVSSVITIPGISDQGVVMASISCAAMRPPISQSRKVFFYYRGNYDSISNELNTFCRNSSRFANPWI